MADSDINGNLMKACEEGDLETVVRLLEEGADKHCRDGAGRTLLHLAAAGGHIDVIRWLTENASADVTAVDDNGDTPMHLAIQFRPSSQNHDSGLSLVQLLWENGAKINCQNKNQKTPLDLAVHENNTEVMTFLLSVGADVDLLDQHFIHIRSRFGGRRLLDFVTAECLEGYNGETTKWQCFKTVILGEVESGKTSLRKTMKYRKPHLTEKTERTVGVEQDVIFLDEHLQSCFLDFGGNETYTFVHQACMTNQTVICIAVDTPKYENKDFPKSVGQWYLRAVSRVFQPYIMIIGTKAETCSEDDLERKQAHIMKSLQIMQKKQNSTFEDNIQNLESKLNDVLNLLSENEEQKTEMIENEEEFIKQVKQFANAHPLNASKIDFIFSKSPGINMSNIMSEISFTRQCLEKQPVVHKQMLFVSSKSMKGIDELRNTICTVVRDNESLFPVFDIPVAWRNVIQAIPPSEPLLSNDKFKELCKSKGIGDITLIEKLLGYLKAAGIVFQYDDHRPLSELENVIFLKPNWIFEIIGNFYNHFYLSGKKKMPAIGEILQALNLTQVDLEYVHVELNRSGIMSEKVIKYILRKCDVTIDKMKYVLGLLVYLDICCLHVASGEPDSQERKYRFPFLLPETPDPVSAYEWPAKCPGDIYEYHLHVYFDSPVDLPGLFDKWSIRTNDHFVKRFDWKKGCIAVLKNGCGKVRILNHSSDSEGDVYYSVCARVKPEKSATMRNVLQTVQIQLRYLHQQYPYAVMKSWVVCPACEIPGQWPLDKIIKIQPEEEESVTCDKCGTTMPIHRLFPMHSVRSIGGLTDFRFELFLGLSGDVEKLAVELLGGSYAKEVLKEAKTEYPHNIEEHCALVLKKWSQLFSTDATFRRLVEALLEIRRKDLADIIEKRFSKEAISLDRPWERPFQYEHIIEKRFSKEAISLDRPWDRPFQYKRAEMIEYLSENIKANELIKLKLRLGLPVQLSSADDEQHSVHKVRQTIETWAQDLEGVPTDRKLLDALTYIKRVDIVDWLIQKYDKIGEEDIISKTTRSKQHIDYEKSDIIRGDKPLSEYDGICRRFSKTYEKSIQCVWSAREHKGNQSCDSVLLVAELVRGCSKPTDANDYEGIQLRFIDPFSKKPSLKNLPILSKLDDDHIGKIIRKHSARLMTDHRNITYIHPSAVRIRDGVASDPGTYITICCKAKGLVPLGDKLFPEKLDDINVDILEDYVFAFSARYDNLKVGCSISHKDGIKCAGTLGGFCRDEINQIGLLTCYHCSVPDAGVPVTGENVVQPARCFAEEVEENICGTFITGQLGKMCFLDKNYFLDIAVSKINHDRLPTDGFFDQNLLLDRSENCHFPSMTTVRMHNFHGEIPGFVFKVGQLTKTTTGMVISANSQLMAIHYEGWMNGQSLNDINGVCLLIKNVNPDVAFAGNGDSGSLVFYLRDNVPHIVGMVFGGTPDGDCLVCPIVPFLNRHSLSLLSYRPNGAT